MSPDGQTIVTGAADETLRFWNVFPPLKSRLVQLLLALLIFIVIDPCHFYVFVAALESVLAALHCCRLLK